MTAVSSFSWVSSVLWLLGTTHKNDQGLTLVLPPPPGCRWQRGVPTSRHPPAPWFFFRRLLPWSHLPAILVPKVKLFCVYCLHGGRRRRPHSGVHSPPALNQVRVASLVVDKRGRQAAKPNACKDNCNEWSGGSPRSGINSGWRFTDRGRRRVDPCRCWLSLQVSSCGLFATLNRPPRKTRRSPPFVRTSTVCPSFRHCHSVLYT